jgi:hypothetical protein
MFRLKMIVFAVIVSGPLSAGVIDYKYASLTNLNVSSFDFGGVNVTGGPRLIFVNVSNGLSILGGGSNFGVDPGEFLDFAFDLNPATAISFFVNQPTSASGTIQAFGPGGSLGTQALTILGTVDVSSLYASQPISHFTLATTSPAVGYRFDTLTFTAAVPEPASSFLVLLGLMAAAALAHRQRLRAAGTRVASAHTARIGD